MNSNFLRDLEPFLQARKLAGNVSVSSAIGGAKAVLSASVFCILMSSMAKCQCVATLMLSHHISAQLAMLEKRISHPGDRR